MLAQTGMLIPAWLWVAGFYAVMRSLLAGRHPIPEPRRGDGGQLSGDEHPDRGRVADLGIDARS
ncbi:hypothetical protein LJK87_07050 [Paenibacillus sp. P25]|nr:hypothetical protein LJK87_07050 [Paenibacillus sp. P25]